MNWLEDYRVEGFAVFANLLPADLIDAHVAGVTALLHRHGVRDSVSRQRLAPGADDALMTAMLDLHRNTSAAEELIHQRVVRALLRQLFQAEPLLLMALTSLWQAGEAPAHVDTAFRSPEPPYSLCRAWCALEDIDPRSGRFFLLPGTHRSLTPRLCMEIIEENPQIAALAGQAEADPASWFRLHARGWPLVSAKIPGRIDPNQKTSFDLKKGDVIIFNPAMAHGTCLPEDKNLSRKIMICEWTTPEAYMREYRPQRPQSADILPFELAKRPDARPRRAGQAAARRQMPS